MPPARRSPRQDRSRETVDRIVEAGAQVLAQRGYGGASTNRIAAAAGLSPGSLYQYFSGKDEIVGEITRRLVAEFTQAITPALRRAAAVPREQATRLVIEAVLAALERRAELLRAIVDRIPPAEQTSALRDVRTRLGDAIFSLFVIQGIAADEAAYERAAWLIVETSQALAVRYVLDAPAIPRAEFVDALARVIDTLAPASG